MIANQRTLILSFLMLFASCIKKEEKSSAPAAVSRTAPYLWSSYASPKTLRISSDFSAGEITYVGDMANAWETALQNRKDFFDIGATTPEITNSLSNMDTLYDSIFGVYKTTNWPTSLPGSALAVTQIYGERHNVGTANEFVNILHADILINYRPSYFPAGYDFRTVVLHELGHFMGMAHREDVSRSNTVMYPSISATEVKIAPKTVDISDLSSKYSITLALTSNVMALQAEPTSRYVVDPREVGQDVRILMELHTDGECVHKIDGAVFERHRVKLK